MIRVAGIDLSLQSTGVATYADGKFSPHRIQECRRKGAARLMSVRDRVMLVVSSFEPSLVAIEGYSYGSEGRWFDLGEMGGVIRLSLFEHSIPYIVVPPATLKKFATGNSGATKAEMIKAASVHYGVDTTSDDEADAVALARFAYVFETKDSRRRCELETVKKFREAPEKPKNKAVKVPIILRKM